MIIMMFVGFLLAFLVPLASSKPLILSDLAWDLSSDDQDITCRRISLPADIVTSLTECGVVDSTDG